MTRVKPSRAHLPPLPRRTLLRGAVAGGATASLGLPLLDAMLNTNGTALAQGQALPVRFGTFFFGNGRGVVADRFRPTGNGAGYALSPLLAPLAPVQDYVSVVSGMNARLNNSPQGHHNGSAAMLSGHDFIAQPKNNAPYRSTFAQPSVDQRAAAVLGVDTAFRSLELGLSRSVIRGEGTTLQYISHNGPDSGNPAEIDPRVLFDRLFGAVGSGPSDPAEETRKLLRRSVLDAVLEDFNGLRARVGTADRARLDQHADSIRAVEGRLANMDSVSACAVGDAPQAHAAMNGREPHAERMGALADVLTLALACDLSRVFSFQFSGSAGGPVFWQFGATRTHHELSHDGAAAQGIIEECTLFTMEQLAGLLVKLRDTPDGAGNLLDSLALLVTSDHSDGASHSLNDMPILVAGKAGGGLVHPGVHYASRGEHTNRVLLSLLRAVGVEVATLGEGVALTSEGCSALEA